MPLRCQTAIFLQCICSAARKTVQGRQKILHFLCNNGFWVGMLKVKSNNLVVTGCELGVVALVFLEMLHGDATSSTFRALLQTSPQSAASAQLQRRHFFFSPLCHPRHFFLAPLFTFFTLDVPGHLVCLQVHRLRLVLCLPVLCDSRLAMVFLQIFYGLDCPIATSKSLLDMF